MDDIARITPKQRQAKRKFSPEFKQRIIQESFESNTSVSLVARRYDLNANLVFKWRYLHKKQINAVGTVLLPVSITPDPPSLALANDHQHSIEIDLKTGRLFLNDHVDSLVLRTLIEVIRSC
jgi:transposase